MKHTFVIFIAAVVSFAKAFSPTFTLTCNTDSIVVAISGSVSTGQVYIDGKCAAQATAATSSSHTFNAAACSGGLPALDSQFTVVIQEFAQLTQSTDLVVTSVCAKNLQQQSVSVSGGVTPGTADSATTGSLAPTFTIALEDGSGGTLTSGTVGTAAVLKVTMDTAYRSLFDHKISAISANSVNVVGSGCKLFTSLNNPDLSSSSGVITWSFNLFIPVTSNTRTATTVLLSVTLDVCSSTCSPYSCSARKRRSADNNINGTSTTVSTSIVVYPEEFFRNIGTLTNHILEKQDDMCIPQTSMVAILVALAIALAVCLVITSVMFVKLRSRQEKQTNDMYGVANSSYKK